MEILVDATESEYWLLCWPRPSEGKKKLKLQILDPDDLVGVSIENAYAQEFGHLELSGGVEGPTKVVFTPESAFEIEGFEHDLEPGYSFSPPQLPGLVINALAGGSVRIVFGEL